MCKLKLLQSETRISAYTFHNAKEIMCQELPDKSIFNLPRGYLDDVSLTHVKWQPLSWIYKRSIMKWMHKIYFNKGDQSLQDLFEKNLQQNYAVRNPFKIKIPRYKKEIGRNSLQYRGPCIWNMIPSNIKTPFTLARFYPDNFLSG